VGAEVEGWKVKSLKLKDQSGKPKEQGIKNNEQRPKSVIVALELKAERPKLKVSIFISRISNLKSHIWHLTSRISYD